MAYEISKSNEIKLYGRMYPAIRSCVDNRYKIVISLFAYYAFIINVKSGVVLSNIKSIQIIMSLIFTFFVIFNYINYAKNSFDIQEIEQIEKPKNWLARSILEFIFAFIMILIIWGAFCLIKLDC